jgi:hypothetical protein
MDEESVNIQNERSLRVYNQEFDETVAQRETFLCDFRGKSIDEISGGFKGRVPKV